MKKQRAVLLFSAFALAGALAFAFAPIALAESENNPGNNSGYSNSKAENGINLEAENIWQEQVVPSAQTPEQTSSQTSQQALAQAPSQTSQQALAQGLQQVPAQTPEDMLLEEVPTTYDLYLAGTQIDSNHLTGTLGSGTYSFSPSTKTLTLTNATIANCTATPIYSQLDQLNIVLVGTNTISSEKCVVPADGFVKAIHATGSLTIQGPGSLIITDADCGIEAGTGDIAISTCTLDLNIRITAISVAFGNISIVSSKINCPGGEYGVFIERAGNISIRSSEYSGATIFDSFITNNGDIFVDNSHLQILKRGHGAFACRNLTIDNHSNIFVEDGYIAVETNRFRIANNSILKVRASDNAILIYGEPVSATDFTMQVESSTLILETYGEQSRAIATSWSPEDALAIDGRLYLSDDLTLSTGKTLDSVQPSATVGYATAVVIKPPDPQPEEDLPKAGDDALVLLGLFGAVVAAGASCTALLSCRRAWR